jgi:hypothetical protein
LYDEAFPRLKFWENGLGFREKKRAGDRFSQSLSQNQPGFGKGSDKRKNKTVKITGLTALLPVFIMLSSCAITKNHLDPNISSYETRPQFRGGMDINGIFPEAVYIKTPTQTFNAYHYYILNNGLIWYKSINSEKKPREWTPFKNTGLPHDFWKFDFNKPKRIVEISADADELIALSEEGGFYRYCFDQNIAHKRNTWVDRQGWPVMEQLFLDKRTAKNISWALGKRNNHVLYYEDVFGNQHHNGTMEIVTIYVLLEDGQEICYADAGLRSDFSRNYIGPERGAFKAAAFSVSASTMFVINDAGEMYTRLADFDTIGCDPMFFKYTYVPYKSTFSGSNYLSNLTEWGLPAEDWRAQPPIPLNGKARLSRHITILQNGQGNGARELRVAGLNEKGNTGYWTKAIFDDSWTFKAVPLYLPAGSLLPDTGNTGERGKTLDVALRGFQWNGRDKEYDAVYEIPNFNILEGSCELRITKQDEVCSLTLYPVELWTYQKRDFLPGRTGMPKMFWVTLSFEEKDLAGLSENFAAFVRERFGKHNKKLFQYVLVAKNNFCLFWDSDNKNSVVFFTGGTTPDDFSEFNDIWYVDYFDEMTKYNSMELTAGNQMLTRDEIQEKIELNTILRGQLQTKIRVLEQNKILAFSINVGYLSFDGMIRLSPLRFIDIPKFRTMTTFGQKIVLQNSTYIYRIADIQTWVYQKIVDLLDLRISCYTDLAKEMPAGEKRSLPPWFSEQITPYWDIAGFPRTIQGFFLSPRLPQKRELPAILHFTPPATEPAFGWYLTAGSSPSYTLFIDPEKSAKIIYGRKGKLPHERGITIACTLYINPTAKTSLEQRIIEQSIGPFIKDNQTGIKVRIYFDGENFEIQEYPSDHDNKVIFRGKAAF